MKKQCNPILSIICMAVLLFSSLQASAQFTEQGPKFYICSENICTGESFCDRDEALDLACVNQCTPVRAAIAKRTTVPFPIGTEFVLELSDEDGIFSDTPLVLSRFTTSTPININEDIDFDTPFLMPTDLASDNYSLRIRATRTGEEDIFSAISTGVPIAYFDTRRLVTVNDVSAIGLCSGESLTLNVSPDDFSEYEWKFNGEIIAGETGSTLTNVTEPGSYDVRILLPGGCERLYGGANLGGITIYDFNTTAIQINEAPRVAFCPSDVKILSASVTDSDFTYEWFRDGVLQPQYDSAIVNLPESNFGGIYTVTIGGSDTCSLTTAPVEVVNLGSDILTRPPPEIMLLPTEPTLTLSITTNAPPGSTVEWFRNGISFQPALPIDSPGALSIDISNVGLYVASVFANDVCMDTLEATTEVFEPVGFRTVITTLLDCDADSGTLGIENLFGITDTGVEVPITAAQYPLFDFEWFSNGQSTGDTDPTITVTQANIGETYVLDATLRGTTFPTARSNELVVEFLSDNLVIDSSSPFVPPGETVTLSVLQSGNYIYEWFVVINGENQLAVNGDTIVGGQGTNSIEIDTSGQYFVRVTLQDCVIESNIVNIGGEIGESEIIPNVVTPNNDGINDTWLLPDSLFNQQDVEVTIYTSGGRVDFTSLGYQNNWPQENSISLGQEPIYYYIITRNNSVVRKGSITVMR